jgi:hypothetical protein
MAEFPKLKIRRVWDSREEVRDLEKSGYSLFVHGPDMIVLAEGRRITSYEDLMSLATRDSHRDKEFLEILMVPSWPVGG